MLTFLEDRINDPNILRIIGKFLKAGITDNSYQINNFRDKVSQLLFKWLNRRSQKRSFNWDKYNLFRKYHKLPRAKTYISIF